MATDARHPRFIVTDQAVSTPERVAPPPAPLPPIPAQAPRWVDPSGRDLLHSSLAVGAAAIGLTVMVLTSLLIVSVAASHPGPLVPSTEVTGTYPTWLAGPTGVLTGWLNASAHAMRVIFTAGIAVMLGAYVVVAFAAGRLRPAWVIAAIVAMHVIFLLSPPLTLTDVFNYLNYGRMEYVYGLNPYTTIPALEPHGDPTFLLSNWHGLLSPYGPLFTVFTMSLVPLGVHGSFWAIKAVLMVASLATTFLVYRCAQLLGRNPVVAAVIVGANPIVLVWGMGGDHNDFLMLFFLVLAAWLLLRARALRVGLRARPPDPRARGPAVVLKRAWAWLDGMPRPLPRGEPWPWMEVLAGVSLVAAVAIKASAAVLLPIFLFGTQRRMRLLLGLVVGFAAATAMTLVAFGPNLPNLGQQDRLVIPYGLPNLTGLALGLGGETAHLRNVITVLLVVAIGICCLWAWRARRWLTPAGWASLALVVTLSWTLPWYIAWLLPFAALTQARGLRIAAAILAVYIYMAWMPYSKEVFGYLHVYPSTTQQGMSEQTFMNSLLF